MIKSEIFEPQHRMTPDDVPALLRVFGDAEVMRCYPAPFDKARMQSWVAWNQLLDAEHGHGLWAVILRAGDWLPETRTNRQENGGRRIQKAILLPTRLFAKSSGGHVLMG